MDAFDTLNTNLGAPSGSSNFWPKDLDGWLNIINTAGNLYGAYAGQQSASRANRTNIALQREQQAWEERMANTAVQRRADDIEKAGFNRLLAATGTGAATPSVAPATVQPTFRPETTRDIFSAARLQALQADALRSQIYNTSEDTRSKAIVNNAAAKYLGEQERYKTGKLAKENELLQQKIELMGITKNMTAKQLEQFEQMMPTLIQTARQQAAAGKLDLEALENIAKVGGLEAGKVKDLLRIIIDIFKD